MQANRLLYLTLMRSSVELWLMGDINGIAVHEIAMNEKSLILLIHNNSKLICRNETVISIQTVIDIHFIEIQMHLKMNCLNYMH